MVVQSIVRLTELANRALIRPRILLSVNYLASLYRSTVAGCICAILVVSFGIADAALFFRGELHAFFVIAVGLTVIGFLVQVLLIGCFTRLHHTHGTSQEASLVVLAAMLYDIQAKVAADALLGTALMMIAISGLTLGIALFLCGAFNAGRYIRLMPFSMVAGFLAGSGLLIVTFSIAILHGESLSFGEIIQGDSKQAAWKILAGFAMGALLVLFSMLRWSEYTLPALIVGGVAAFHLVITYAPVEFNQLVQLDWTMARDSVAVRYQPMTSDLIGTVDWSAIASVSLQLPALIAVCIFANLIKISSLELMMRQRVDENRELRVAGYAGLVSGVFAVAPGFHGLANSSILAKLSANAKVSAVVTVAVTAALLVYAGDTLMFMPRFVFGAILLWVGFGMVQTSLLNNWGKVRFHESVVTALIALTVAVFGFIPGLAFGVVCGLVMFVAEYSQQETVRSMQSAVELHSNVDRDPDARAQLNAHGRSTWVVRLHSYLFFGSAARSVEIIMRHLDNHADNPIDMLVLDFTRVVGIDSTALRAFQRLALRAEADSIDIWAAGASPSVQTAFEKDGDGSIARFFETLDFALEAAEDRILCQHPLAPRVAVAHKGEGDVALAGLFWQHGVPRALPAGATLLEAGQAPQGLYWVVSGVLDAQVHTPHAEMRVRRMGSGALIGEISWYLQQTTSARVVVVEDASLLHLDNPTMAMLAADFPETSSILHEEIARVLSSRLLDNARQLRQLG